MRLFLIFVARTFVQLLRCFFIPLADNPGSTQSGNLGGQVSNVVLTIDSADRIPTAPSKKITVSFSIQTSLASGMRENLK
jgi:hypothetical protein